MSKESSFLYFSVAFSIIHFHISYNRIICILLPLILAIASCGEEKTAQRQSNRPSNLVRSAEHSTSSSQSTSYNRSADWPMFMYNMSYLGVSPDRTIRPPLSVAWKFKTGGPVNSSPVVVDGTVYVGSDDHRLYALNASKWGEKWEFEAGDRITYAPTVYKGNVYFSARDLKVYALDASNGAKKWEFQADGWINSPVVAFGEKIYFGCYEDKIYILNAATGKRESQVRSRISIGGIEYVCVRGEFYPADAYIRAQTWKKAVPRSESWPATANEVVYIGSRDNKLYAFDLKTHKQIWQFEADGWIDSSPAIADGTLYVGSRDGYVYALKNSDAVKNPATTDALPEGTVTRDRVNIYKQPDEGFRTQATRLNEGVLLPILDRKSGNWYLDPSASWFKVKLPDGQTGWLKAPDFTEIRLSENLQVNASLAKEVKRLILPGGADVLSWSPDGSIMAFFDNISAQGIYWMAGSIWLASGDGSNPRWVSNGAFFNFNISWSGNGEWLAFESLAGTHREIWMVRSNGTGLKEVTVGEAPAVSPKGDMIAFIRRGKSSTSVWLHKLDSKLEKKVADIPIKGQESFVAYSYNASLNPPIWSSDGSLLSVGLDGYHYPDSYSRVAVIKTSGGIVREIADRARRIRNTAFSPDGRFLAYVTQQHSFKQVDDYLDKQVHVVDLAGQVKEKTFDHSEGITWSPDGRYMAFIEENDSMGIKRKVWLLDVKNWQIIQLLSSRENIEEVFWLTRGKISLLAPSSLLKTSKTAPKTQGWIVSISALPG